MSNLSIRRPVHRATLEWLLCTSLLLAMPLINGFPFTYPDTGTYLASAFRGFVPYDRPYWYGVFLRVTSGGGHSLWGPIVAQSMLCAYLLLRTVRHFVSSSLPAILVVVIFLVACTGVSWYAGQLMPDIFTGIGLLALLLLLIENTSTSRLVGYATLLVLAVLVHASNLLAFSIAIALVFLTFRSIPIARRRAAFILIALCWPLLLALNAAVTGRASLGRGGHVFLVARLIDANILPDWLDAHCPGASGLCDYRDRLPTTAHDFLWAPDSPLYGMGGWAAPPDDYDHVVRSALSEPAFLLRFAINSLQGAGRQLIEFHVGAGFNGTNLSEPGDPVHYMLRNTMHQDYAAFLAARQTSRVGNVEWTTQADRLFIPVMVISHLALLLLLLLPSALLPPGWRCAALLVVIVLLSNALVCASLSMVADRFSSRVNWVVPLLVAIALIHLLARTRWMTRNKG
ncbi:MAG: hypothetical protein ABI432_01710 [Flavobacteriales bacterium]